MLHEAFLIYNTLKLHILNETSRLRSVLLGTAKSNGPTPKLEECYDPKSREHVMAGTYPVEKDMIEELEQVAQVFKKYNVELYRPEILENSNQIFARDTGFVIEDKFIIANILPDREAEIDAIKNVWSQVPKTQRMQLPPECHVEGGDVMLWNDHIFVGTYYGEDYSSYITARTNTEAVHAIRGLFPNKTVKSFNLRKHNTDPRENALHLDCCFQPIGKDKAIIHKNGFLDEEEYEWLINFFGRDHIFEIDKEEMYNMMSNIFSISENVVISERNFSRLNDWLRNKGFVVEEVKFSEIAKQEGLLRCATLPLQRD